MLSTFALMEPPTRCSCRSVLPRLKLNGRSCAREIVVLE